MRDYTPIPSFFTHEEKAEIWRRRRMGHVLTRNFHRHMAGVFAWSFAVKMAEYEQMGCA